MYLVTVKGDVMHACLCVLDSKCRAVLWLQSLERASYEKNVQNTHSTFKIIYWVGVSSAILHSNIALKRFIFGICVIITAEKFKNENFRHQVWQPFCRFEKDLQVCRYRSNQNQSCRDPFTLQSLPLKSDPTFHLHFSVLLSPMAASVTPGLPSRLVP